LPCEHKGLGSRSDSHHFVVFVDEYCTIIGHSIVFALAKLDDRCNNDGDGARRKVMDGSPKLICGNVPFAFSS